MKIFLLKNKKKNFLTEKKTYQECCKFISQKIKDYHVISYYSRHQMLDDNSVLIDFGSWCDFFIIEGITWEEVIKGE